MKSYSIFRVFTALTVVALSLFSFVLQAQALGTATVGTTLTIESVTPASIGDPATVVMLLMSSKGLPVLNQPVQLFVNGEPERRAKTDASGHVSITVRRDEAGAYSLEAVFKGSKLPSLGSSRATGELVISPALVEIRTTPSLPDIKFSLDGQIFSSDDYGVARIEVKKVGTYHLVLLPLEAKDPNLQMEFSRWGDDTFEPERDIQVPLGKELQIGFDVSYQVSQTFIDLSDRPVDPARVTSITLKGSNGTTYTFEDNLPHWLPAGRVIRLNNGLEQTKILYSIISVVIDGSNVVSQAQQRFYVNPNDVWPVKLLLYKASFTARDALFHFPTGSGIHMEFPDGDVQTFAFSENNQHTLDGLARGIYKVTVMGVKGIAPPTPIALSRDQTVELLVFSYLDIGVFAGVGLFLSVGLLLFGRPYILTQAAAFGSKLLPNRRKNQPATSPQFFKQWIGRASRKLSKREVVEAEKSASEPLVQEDTQHQISVYNEETPSREGSQEAGYLAEDVNSSAPTWPGQQENQVESLV